MKVVQEDVAATSSESSPPLEDNNQDKPAKRGLPMRGSLAMHKSMSDLDFMVVECVPRADSPRSTLPSNTDAPHGDEDEEEEDEEDGVIRTFKAKPRTEKMTRRHSMSRLFCNPSRSKSSDLATMQTASSSAHTSSFEQVSQMRPGGLQRRNSLRSALQQQMSDGRLQQPPQQTVGGGGSSRRLLMGRRNSRTGGWVDNNNATSPAANTSRPRVERRNSLRNALMRSSSEESFKGNNNNNTGGSTRRLMGRRNSVGGACTTTAAATTTTSPTSPNTSGRPRLMRRGSSRGGGSFLMRTASYRKQDSLREWNPSGGVGNSNSSQGSLREGVGTTTTRRNGLKRQGSVADLIVDCNTTVSVSNTWASVRHVDDYQRRLGEQVVLRLVELEPTTARKDLRLDSLLFGAERLQEICTTLCTVIDMIVTLLGPDLDDATADLARLGQQCRDQGIHNMHLLGDAVSSAVAVLLGDDVTADMVKAWKITFDALSRRLAIRVEE